MNGGKNCLVCDRHFMICTCFAIPAVTVSKAQAREMFPPAPKPVLTQAMIEAADDMMRSAPIYGPLYVPNEEWRQAVLSEFGGMSVEVLPRVGAFVKAGDDRFGVATIDALNPALYCPGCTQPLARCDCGGPTPPARDALEPGMCEAVAGMLLMELDDADDQAEIERINTRQPLAPVRLTPFGAEPWDMDAGAAA